MPRSHKAQVEIKGVAMANVANVDVEIQEEKVGEGGRQRGRGLSWDG